MLRVTAFFVSTSCSEAGLSSTPYLSDVRGEHLNLLSFLFYFWLFLLNRFCAHWKRVFDHEVDNITDSGN